MGQRVEGEAQASGPGATLAAARKAAGRQLADISIELCIGQNHLESIERNHFDGMGGPTYVKGYLRAYARTLGLDPDSIITQYLEQNPQEVLVQPRKAVETAPEKGAGKLIGVSLVAALLAAILLAWFLRNSDESPTPERPAPEVSTPSGSSETGKTQAAPSKSEDATAHWIEEAPPLTPEKATPRGEDLQNQGAPSTDSGLEKQAVKATSPPRESGPKETGTASESSGDESPTTADADSRAQPPHERNTTIGGKSSTAADTGLPPKESLTPAVKPHAGIGRAGDAPIFVGAGKDTIELDLSQDSWVQIQDNTGAVLLQGLYTAGTARKIQGEAPFQVFLGNAPGVTVQFNGKPFDSSSYVRSNNTARFALVPK